MAHILTQPSGSTATRTLDLSDLGITSIRENRPQRVVTTPLLAAGRWHTEWQGAAPASYQMRGTMPWDQSGRVDGSSIDAIQSAAWVATRVLDRMMETDAPISYIRRRVNLLIPNSFIDTRLALVRIRGWQVENPDLIDGEPVACRRWTLTLAVIDPLQA